MRAAHKALDQAVFFDWFLLRGLRPLKASAIPEAGAEAEALAETAAVAEAGGMRG